MSSWGKRFDKYVTNSSTTKSSGTGGWGERFDKYVDVDISPTISPRISTVGSLTKKDESLLEEEKKKWYESGLFEDGYDFGDVTKTLLGISDKKKLKTFTAPETTLTLKELKEKYESYQNNKWRNADEQAESLKNTQQLNEKALYEYSQTLSKIKMDGTNRTVLEEIEILANMKSGKEKEERKQKVLQKMELLGMDTAYYSHFAGDGEFDWNTFGKWLSNSAMAGLNTFNKGLLDTADVLLGAPMKALGWENNPISEGAEYYDALYNTYRYNANLYAEKLGGNAWNFGTDAVEGTIGALPNTLLMFMTGGQSATATTSTLANQAAAQTGNILTKAGLTTETMLKNPQFWTSFARTLGSDYKEAKESGASDIAASIGSVLKSLVNSGIEIGFDGGSGIQGLPSGLKEGGKPFWEWVESSIEEGGEEILQKFVGEAIDKVGYGSDKEMLNPIEYAKEGMLGVISGAALGAGQTAVQSGVNTYANYQANKLTNMEQTVADKVVEKEIAKRESDGKTVTAQDKKQIQKNVENNLRKGYLNAEDIEEVLGGESYNNFKSEMDKFTTSEDYQNLKKATEAEKKAKDEFDALVKMKQGDMTGEQVYRRDELKKILDESKVKDLRGKLGNEANRIMDIRNQMRSQVMDTVKDSRLAESYRELARKQQKFQVDINKYTNENAKKTVQAILDSGLGDNSNQFHDVVDFLAKISEDKNVTFNLTNNAKLEGTEHYKKGYITHGFSNDNGDIVLNKDSDRVIQTTVGHEVTHVLEKAGIYKELSAAVRDFAISKEGLEKYNARLAAAQEAYAGKKNTTAEKEITADLIGEYLFTDSEFVSKLSTSNRNVFQKIYDEIKYLCKVVTAGSKEARELEKVKKLFDQAWRENVKGKDESKDVKHSYSSIANSFFGKDKATDEFFEEDYHQTEGYKSYVDKCLNNLRQTALNFDEDFERARVQNSIDGIVRVAVAAKQAGYDIADDAQKRTKTDSKNRLLFSSIEPNSDYFTSHDISTICDKRKNFAEIYDEIVRMEEAKGVPKGKRFFDNVDNYFAIHDIMAKQGLTTPCRQCYVESMRKNLAPMARAFLDLVQETDPNNIANAQLWQKAKKDATDYVVGTDGKKYAPKQSNTSTREFVLAALVTHPEYNMSVNDLTIEMLTTADGLAQLRLQAPMVYEAFNSFYGQAKPKMPKAATPFRFGELTALLTDDKGKIKRSLVEKINSTGGFRLQSYSDFQIQNYVDVLQVLFEAGTLGLNGHAYTKVPAFIEATNGTNLKRNISIFMYKDGNEWKLDRNDSFPYSLEEIYDIVNSDASGNTSIIAVSQNSDMSAWIMANDNVGYGIPFHKSGLKMDTVRKTVVREGGREINGYTGTIDHTKYQTEVYAKTVGDSKANKKVKKGINIYSFWDFDNESNLSKAELIEKNVKAYIDQCEMLGYLPKFRNYVMNNGKVLNDVLKYSKELGFVSEDATIADISFEYKGYQIPYGYYKFLGDFGMFTPDGQASPQQILSLDGYDFDKAVEFFADAESLRRTEILQQFATGKTRSEYAEGDMTTEELDALVKQKRTEVAKEATKYSVTKAEKAKMDEDYFAAIESGDEEVQKHLVREYAKASMPDSKLVDENGNLRVVYHGTNTGDFTVFNPDYIGMSSGDDGFFGMGFYFAYSKGEASYYGAKRIIPAYLNLTNPFNFDRELRTYNGSKARYGHAPDAVALMNFADKFPDIAMNITMGAMKNGESYGKSISVFEFAKAFKDIIENKEFDYQEITNEFGETETLVTADPQVHEYEYNGETHTWRDFGFQKRFMYDHDILDVAYEYLSNAVYSYIDIPRFTSVILYNNREFTAELKDRGYDGTIQSEYGDEAVAFYPNQIKSADPITRDADGNVIPLSKRFDENQDDIRYSMTKAEVEKEYQLNIDNNDMAGAEAAVEQMANLMMPDSKIRGENGRLIPVYHGTNADFWEFDTSADGGKNGTAEGFGIYLSDNQDVTNAYGDRQIKMFANITKPATSFKKTIKASTLVKLIKQTCERQAKQMVEEEGYDSIRDAIRDTWVSNYADTYSTSMDQAYREVANFMIQQNDNDKDIVQEVMFGMAIRSYDQAMDFYKNSLIPVTGIDGFITKWDNANTGEQSNIYLAFDSSQLKSADAVTYDQYGDAIPLSERFNSDSKDIRYSISNGEENTYGDFRNKWSDFGYHDELDDFAPIRESAPKVAEASDLFPENFNTPQMELDNLNQEKEALENSMLDMSNSGDFSDMPRVDARWKAVRNRIAELEKEISDTESERLNSIGDEDAPPEMDAPYYGENSDAEVPDPFADRDMHEVGNKKVKAYQYENPEVKPYFTEAALGMLDDLHSGTKGEKWYNDELHYESGGEKGWMGTKRHTTPDIAALLDQWHYTYAEIEDGLNAIIEDDGKENNAVSKRIEFMLHDRLVNGYTGVWGEQIPPNQEYIDFLQDREISEYSREAFDSFMETADMYAPVGEDFTPIRADVAKNATNARLDAGAYKAKATADDIPTKTTKEKLNEKLSSRQTELENVQKHRDETIKSLDEKIAKAKAQLDSKKNKDTKVANNLKMRIERLQRLKADIDAKYTKRISDINKSIGKTSEELEKDHTEKDRYAAAKARIEADLEAEKSALMEEYAQRRGELESKTVNKDAYFSNKARELYEELRNLRKGVRASVDLGSLLDFGYDWGNLRSSLSNVRYNPSQRVNPNSVEESAVRQLIEESYESDVYGIDDLDVELAEKIHKLEADAETKKETARRATQRRKKAEEHTKLWSDLIGDTSTWKDMKTGLHYKTKTLRRILRHVVKDGRGNPDIRLADDIYDELETKYDHNEALLKKESAKLKEVFKNLKLSHAEDQYAQMLGELRYNPETTLTEDVVKEYLKKHKGINEAKVDKAIKESRKLYDDLIVRVNEVLREQGFKEIPYRQGYFPHFTNPKQNWVAKLLNWKTIDTEIPTSIAGLTEMFKPNRSWQKFNKQRMGDKTDYSLYQGLDSYIHGALDWIYHIEDLQKRRSLENYIRYTHSDEGVKQRINEILNSNYDADEAQTRINAVLDEAHNPLSGLVRELMNRTNTLANKKSAVDRGMEDMLNRKIYSTMTNLNNRITANMVVGSFSSAMTNFIPMVQSWHQVSPWYTVRGIGDTVRSAIKDDGTIAKSDFLTNRLMEEEKLYKTSWDKASDVAAFMMSAVDNITSQTVWRSKYLQNLREGMSEAQAIRDADQFAKNLMAGRSRGNAPSIFDAKNPLVKIFTAFQLEVANQYGYMFEDVPQDSKNIARMVKGYATAFLGAYAYNALYSTLVGRDAAFDPISIIEDLMKGLFNDDEEEEDDLTDDIMDFGKDVLQEVPFVGGLLGGGRIPLSSAFPYSGYSNPIESMLTDLSEGELSKEWLKPLYYLALPFGGGQLKKTNEGLGMFSEEHPIAGSYTASGNLRFPVEDTIGNRIQAAMFGQYANENARDYFDNERSALKPEQIEEFIDVDIPIRDYWDYREGLAEYDKWYDKADYIANLDLPIDKKNILINNISTREDPIDLRGYENFSNYEEFDWAKQNPEKYEFFKEIGVSVQDYKDADEETKADYNWAYNYPHYYTLSKAISDDPWEYRGYYKDMSALKADKDANGKSISGSKKAKVIDYINGLNIDYGAKLVLFKSQYEADDTYNKEIFEYIRDKESLSFEDKLSILKTLGYGVSDDGTTTWD